MSQVGGFDPAAGAPTTGQIAVDQQRNQMLATIAKALAIFSGGGTINGNLVVTGTITPSQVGGIVGTNTNNNAQAGSVGEYIPSDVPVGTAVTLVSGTSSNITSISLSPGDWDVWGSIALNSPASNAVPTLTRGWISTTSATQPTALENNGALFSQLLSGVTLTADVIYPVGSMRLSLATTTTVYLTARVIWTTGGIGAYGYIAARRRR